MMAIPIHTQAALILAIIEAIIKYGPPAVMKIAELMKTQDPTAEDVSKLFITKEPEEYFK